MLLKLHRNPPRYVAQMNTRHATPTKCSAYALPFATTAQMTDQHLFVNVVKLHLTTSNNSKDKMLNSQQLVVAYLNVHNTPCQRV